MLLLGELSALLTAFLWSVTSMLFAAAAIRIGSVQLNVTRQLFAIIILGVIIILFQIEFSLSSSQILNLAISGLFGLAFGDSFLFKAYQQIGARVSMLIMSSAPIMSAILAYFILNEIIYIWGIVGMLITIGGIALVVLERKESNSSTKKFNYLGIFFGFLGAAGQGIALIFAKLAFNEGSINGLVATIVRLISSIIILLPITLLFGKFKNPIKAFMLDTKALSLTIGGSIAGPVLGITFSLIAIANAKVGIAATIMGTVPVIMLPLVKYFYKEELSWRAILGALITVAGVAVLFMR